MEIVVVGADPDGLAAAGGAGFQATKLKSRIQARYSRMANGYFQNLIKILESGLKKY